MTSTTFDPWTQNVTFHFEDGTPFQVPISAIDEYQQYPIRICINYGAQLGATLILLVILLLLTRAEKRKSCVFCLNCLALLLNFARLLCATLFYTSEFVRVYAYFSGDYSRVPRSDYANSVLGIVFNSLLLTFIEVSLVLQVQVVCANLRRKYRHSLLAVTATVGLIPIAFNYWFMVENAKNIVSTADPNPLHWLESACNIVLTVSICFFCAVFATKLGFAIRLRRKLGMTDFGPMKVIFIMGCQTMVIPAIFSIIHYATDIPEFASNVLTLVTLSLPLSSIWAGTTLDKSSSNSAGRNLWQILSLSGRGKEASTSTFSSAKPCTKCYSDSQTMSENSERQNHGPSPSQYGIAVEHDISVQSAKRESFGDV